jgi:DNA polymerase-3 subunit beta
MKLQLQRETLLKPLQQVVGVVERRQTLPILAHVLLDAQTDKLVLTATDLEVELMALEPAVVTEPGITTLPARKLLDIVRSLPESNELTLERGESKVELRSGSGRFTLAPLAADDFPAADEIEFESEFSISQRVLRQLLERTHFAMAQQDVRYYLNGLFIETDAHQISAVATDGHRLAVCELGDMDHDLSRIQVIVPRKGVQELMRLLEDPDSETLVQLGGNHLRVSGPDFRFTSRLIDGRFPDYRRVIPSDDGHRVTLDRQRLRCPQPDRHFVQ